MRHIEKDCGDIKFYIAKNLITDANDIHRLIRLIVDVANIA